MKPLPVVVDNRVRIPLEYLSERTATLLREEFQHVNPDREERASRPLYKTWEEADGDLTFPRGGMAHVRHVLKAQKRKPVISDRRVQGDWSLLDHGWDGTIPAHQRTLWDFQERIVAAVEAKHNCIVEAHTGTGKSTACLALASRRQMPTLVIVNTGGLRDQWVERIETELGVPRDKVGIIGDGKRTTAPITIAMQQTLARGIEPHWLSTFGMVICDEVDLFAAPTFFAAVDPWPAAFRVGVTATFKRHDKKEFMVSDLFGDVVARVTEEEAVDKGRTVEVEFRVVPTEFDAPWYREATQSNNKWWIRNAHRKLIEMLWQNEARNEIVRGVVSAEVGRDNQVMVISTRREHCLQLDRSFIAMGIPSGVMLGGAEAKSQFKKTLEGVRSGRLKVVVGTDKAIGRGQDFPAIGVGVVTMPVAKDETLVKQIKGRFCRACEETGKIEGVLYFIWDRYLQGRTTLTKLLKVNERTVVQDDDGKWVSVQEYIGDLKPEGRRARGLSGVRTAASLAGR
jgi:superfamily II DNA or RNA helicase